MGEEGGGVEADAVMVAVSVFTATGILDSPAETVDVAVATAPPATAVQAKRKAETPYRPS